MPRHFILPILLAALALVQTGCSASNAAKQTAALTPLDHLPALKGDYFKIESTNVGRAFHIYVRYPEGYTDNTDKKYPIVYLLDGDSLFPILASNHLFLHYDDKLPEAIVVGIAYGGFDPSVNKRGYDFSAPADDAREGQGGAPKFHAFLENELLPTVENKYRIDAARRILFGQSRGGYMILYSAFTKPDLFWGRIATNPSFFPGKDFFYSAGKPSKRGDLKLIVASGENDHERKRELALEWRDHWEGRAGAPWQTKLITIPGGTHAANSTDAYRAGMRAIFGLDVPEK